MQPARIAELLQPFLGTADDQRLGTNGLLSISMYIDILIRWNARINLTAIRDPEEIVTRHFGESFFAACHLFPDPSVDAAAKGPQNAALTNVAKKERPSAANDHRLAVADLGSGAGFPGLPIKLWVPNIALTLIESNQKKATFLREVARALTLTDVNIQNARAEILSPATFDVVTVRAVERFAETLATAANLLVPAGRVALLIGSSQVVAAQSALPQFSWDPPFAVPMSSSRVLLSGRRFHKQVSS